MRTKQAVIRRWPGDRNQLSALSEIAPQLLLVFGSPLLLADPEIAQTLAEKFPQAIRIGCSTAGEIAGGEVTDGCLIVTAAHFAHSPLTTASTLLASMEDSRAAGERLGKQLNSAGLKGVIVFGQGVGINGSALVEGLASQLAAGMPISGGLAGDDGAFKQTWVLDNGGLSADRIVALGLHGEHVRLSHGCFGGWQAFGPMRKVTRSAGNVLYELDGEPALEIYKRYLGDHASKLPASGLLFPFEMFSGTEESAGLIRTILGIDEAAGSLILAGEIDPNGYLRLMHAQTDRLVDGAEDAAQTARSFVLQGVGEGIALLVSCVGRKLVMGGRTEEEVEAVQHVLGSRHTLAGFYSYGEISPMAPPGVGCKLHNQTMTITLIEEA